MKELTNEALKLISQALEALYMINSNDDPHVINQEISQIAVQLKLAIDKLAV